MCCFLGFDWCRERNEPSKTVDFVGFDLAHAEAETVWVLVSVYRFYFVQLNRFANLL